MTLTLYLCTALVQVCCDTQEVLGKLNGDLEPLVGVGQNADLAEVSSEAVSSSQGKCASRDKNLTAALMATTVRHEATMAEALNQTGSCNKAPSRQISIYCWSFVRHPVEKTASLLHDQLSKACDMVALFEGGQENDEERRRGQMKKRVWGVLSRLIHDGVLESCTWIVRFETDTFVRPSALRPSVERYPPGFKSVLTFLDTNPYGIEDRTPEGYFLAAPSQIVKMIYEYGRSSNTCDVLLTGHNTDPNYDEKTKTDECITALNIGPVLSLTNSRGEFLVTHHEFDEGLTVEAGDPYGRCDNSFAEQADLIACHPVKSPLAYKSLMMKYI